MLNLCNDERSSESKQFIRNVIGRLASSLAPPVDSNILCAFEIYEIKKIIYLFIIYYNS